MLKRIDFETEHQYKKREWFISNYIKSKPKTSRDELERLSEIWINMITLNCRYPASIEKNIHQFIKNNK